MAAWRRDQRLGHLRRSMEGLDAPGKVSPITAVGRMEAAVALVIRAGTDLDVLLIKRAEHEHDPWSGHMALPGGRWEPGDLGLQHTATRETLEETGRRPQNRGSSAGSARRGAAGQPEGYLSSASHPSRSPYHRRPRRSSRAMNWTVYIGCRSTLLARSETASTTTDPLLRLLQDVPQLSRGRRARVGADAPDPHGLFSIRTGSQF